MFNGIIYNQGKVKSKKYSNSSCFLEISSSLKFKKDEIGSSICCNGVCLTLIKVKGKLISFFLSKETINKSNFKNVKIGDWINIEKPMIYGQDVSGHFTQGHVDTTGNVIKLINNKKTWILGIRIPKEYRKFLLYKSSITVNGVSLTISKIIKDGFEVNIIPHSLKLTNLINIKKKDIANVELDLFSKYLSKLRN
jgi:riboflavin synthase